MKFIQWLFPPAVREHVLGDLQERGSGLLGILTTLAFVVFSQARRKAPIHLILAQAATIALTFAMASKSFDPLILISTLVGTAVLILGDAYAAPERRPDVPRFLLAACAYSVIEIFTYCFPALGFGPRVVAQAAGLGFFLIPAARATYFVLAKRRAGAPALESDIRKEAEKFHARIVARNRRELIAGVVVILTLLLRIITSHDMTLRITLSLVIVGALVAGVELLRRASAHEVPASLGEQDIVRGLRAEMERQRDALHSIAAWYVAPMLVPIVITFSFAKNINPAPNIVFAILFGAFVTWLNRRAAQALQRKIDNLNQLLK